VRGLGNIPLIVGLEANYLWAFSSVSIIILRPILHLWNAKLENNTGLIGNFKELWAHFGGIKE